MVDGDNPLLKALPPETDYLSYLTILEYNLTADQLPVLHDILQDTTLTANIGWDLVHLLLPLLPASRPCLHDLARLGNPREVVLKVTELLEEIATANAGSEDEEEQEEEEDGGKEKARRDTEGPKETGPDAEVTALPDQDLKALQFSTLLDMLAILHPRIKTKYPSRFLSTSLQAVLSAYSKIAADEGATDAVLGFVKELSGNKRPILPPRRSSSRLPTVSTHRGQESAPDPEAREDLGPGEGTLQNRLLQSFLTYVAEVYLASATDDEYDVAGMAWSSRYQEKTHPEKIIPGRRTYNEIFVDLDAFHERESTMGQISALARDLKIDSEELLKVISTPETHDPDENNDLPSSPTDVPLSRAGSLYLAASLAAASTLYDAPPSLTPLSLPEFFSIINNLIDPPSSGALGTEPPSYLDALYFLGFFILEPVETIKSSSEAFNNSLQRLSMLSANTPSPTLRFHAHTLASRMLHLHPSEDERLSFIRDTLEHCPYENLKGSAVGWLKDEMLASVQKPSSGESIFASPAVLQILAPSLFLAIPIEEPTALHFSSFGMNQVFYLAVLNLLFLLTSSRTLFERLRVSEILPHCTTKFLSPLLENSRAFEVSLLAGELGEDQDGIDRGVAEMRLLQMNVGQIMDAISRT